MKKYISITILLIYFVGGPAVAQNKINGYQYWFDDDFASFVAAAVTPMEYLELSTSIPTEGLNSGIHIFNIRFWDESLAYSTPLSRFFFIKPAHTVINKEIVAWQMWFDNNFEEAVTQNIAPAQQYNLINDIDVNELPSGIHMVHFRFKDNTETWSTTISQFFFKKPAQTVINKEIVAWQMWFDNNFVDAVTQNIAPAQQYNLINDIDVNELASGIHMVHVRFKDNTETWSTTLSQFFFKKPEQTVDNKEIVAWQYWINENFENAITQNITPAQSFKLIDNLDVNEMSAGIHRIHFRFKDNSGIWSIIQSQFFIKKEVAIISDNELIVYRYWFDENFDLATEEQFSPTGSGINLISNIDMTQVWKGEHSIHFQFKDVFGQWSVVATDSVTKHSLPIAAFEYSSQLYCDSTLINMVNNSIDGDAYLWDFGDGNVSEAFEPAHTFYAPGDYSVSLTVTDTILGIDSTMVEIITVISNVTYSAINPVACDSYNSPSGVYTWTVSGTYMDTIPNSMGCDSIINVDLTVHNSTFVTITETACDTYTSPSGMYTWTSGGIYMDTIPNVAGCDSVITVDLTIHYSSAVTLTETACFSYISPSENYTWTLSGSYMDTIQTVMGCDSILTINLTINTVDTTVTVSDPTLTANATGATYQWIDCGTMLPIQGETNQSFTATANGIYAVEVTQNNCLDTSACYEILSVDWPENIFGANFNIYPNPTDGFVSIHLGRFFENLYVKVMDYQGREQETAHYQATEKVNLELKGAKGLYFIDIKTSEGKSVTIKVLKE